jgi:hypothetical protein
MTDMSAAIIPKSDQLNADDLLTGRRTIKITSVAIKGGQEQPVAISYEGDQDKPYKPCKSMSRVLVHAWGADANKYVGRSLTLYCDPKVKWAGMEVGGIRISHMSHIDSALTMALTATKGSRKPFTVKPMEAAVVAPADSEKESTLRFALENAGMTEAWFLAQTGKQSLSEVTNVKKALAWIAAPEHAEPAEPAP